MKMLALGSVVCCAQLLLAPSPSSQQEDESRILKIVRGGWQIDVIDNSPTLSQVLAINNSGAVIGVRERVNAEQTIFSMSYFYCDQDKSLDLPQLAGYTNIEATGLSDNGLVVGYASRPVGTAGGSLTAITWDAKSDKAIPLTMPASYTLSHAQHVSADGRRVTGYVGGSDPPRMQPCVWTRGDDPSWTAQVLETTHEYNPFIQSSNVLISPNGKRIAACCTADTSRGFIDSSLFIWEDVDGKWVQRLFSDDAFFLRDMNDEGLIVGCVTKARALRFPCYMDADAKLTMIDLLPDDASGEAHGVNASGEIVGFSDDPRGPLGGPQAFTWKVGKTTPLDLGDAPFSSAHAINDSGQIGGMLDLVLESAESEEGVEKTLAFRRLSPVAQP